MSTVILLRYPFQKFVYSFSFAAKTNKQTKKKKKKNIPFNQPNSFDSCSVQMDVGQFQCDILPRLNAFKLLSKSD